jgi:hypothetical protein
LAKQTSLFLALKDPLGRIIPFIGEIVNSFKNRTIKLWIYHQFAGSYFHP